MKALLTALGLLVGAELACGGVEKGNPAPEVAETLPPLNLVPQGQAKQPASPAPAILPALPAAKTPAAPNYALLQNTPPDVTGAPAQNTAADSDSRGLGVVGGAGFYYIQPLFSSNPAFFQTRITTNGAGTTSATQTGITDFNWNFQVAPRFWLGYVLSDSWMVRARYWQFQESSQGIGLVHAADAANVLTTIGTVGLLPFASTPLAAGSPADVLSLGSGLRLNVYDLEFARSAETTNWWFQYSAGLRYAQLEQYYNAGMVNAGDAALGFVSSVRQQQEHSWFHGGGPTLSGQAFYLFGGGFSLYADGRGSLLYGRTRYAAAESFLGGVPAVQSFSADGGRDAFLPIGEIELGIGWSTDIGRTHWLVKTGFIGQVWWEGGAAAIPAGGLGAQSPTFSNNVLPLATSSSSNLGFYGWTLSLGVQF